MFVLFSVMRAKNNSPRHFSRLSTNCQESKDTKGSRCGCIMSTDRAITA